MKKKHLSLSLFLGLAMALPVHAETGQITKSAAGKIIFVYSNGEGLDQNLFIAGTTAFPPGTLNNTKTLTLVRYQIAAYPQATSDTTELCYSEPYQSSPARCVQVLSGSTGSTSQFNDLRFGAGAQLMITHKVTGQSGNLHPSGEESATWEYSY
ncbi:hypothetical protein ACFWP0_10940 [Achromobacter sp. NPDC058515]|uniref:hypothetical protein n=1 Tax=Achromobacter sp. NPDC058515 TaxID=3346533 RepID=UPI003652664F